MKVFLDFKALSLTLHSYLIEAVRVVEDGRPEAELIAPAAEWADWNQAAEAFRGIGRAVQEAEGEDHQLVPAGMAEAPAGHDLFANASSWDGKWLSVLMRAASLPRHPVKLRATDQAIREAVADILWPIVPPSR